MVGDCAVLAIPAIVQFMPFMTDIRQPESSSLWPHTTTAERAAAWEGRRCMGRRRRAAHSAAAAVRPVVRPAIVPAAPTAHIPPWAAGALVLFGAGEALRMPSDRRRRRLQRQDAKRSTEAANAVSQLDEEEESEYGAEYGYTDIDLETLDSVRTSLPLAQRMSSAWLSGASTGWTMERVRTRSRNSSTANKTGGRARRSFRSAGRTLIVSQTAPLVRRHPVEAATRHYAHAASAGGSSRGRVAKTTAAGRSSLRLDIGRASASVGPRRCATADIVNLVTDSSDDEMATGEAAAQPAAQPADVFFDFDHDVNYSATDPFSAAEKFHSMNTTVGLRSTLPQDVQHKLYALFKIGGRDALPANFQQQYDEHLAQLKATWDREMPAGARQTTISEQLVLSPELGQLTCLSWLLHWPLTLPIIGDDPRSAHMLNMCTRNMRVMMSSEFGSMAATLREWARNSQNDVQHVLMWDLFPFVVQKSDDVNWIVIRLELNARLAPIGITLHDVSVTTARALGRFVPRLGASRFTVWYGRRVGLFARTILTAAHRNILESNDPLLEFPVLQSSTSPMGLGSWLARHPSCVLYGYGLATCFKTVALRQQHDALYSWMRRLVDSVKASCTRFSDLAKSRREMTEESMPLHSTFTFLRALETDSELLVNSVRDTAGGNWATHLATAVEARRLNRALTTAQLIHLGMSDGGSKTQQILRDSVRDTAGGNWATHLATAVEACRLNGALTTAQLSHLGNSDAGHASRGEGTDEWHNGGVSFDQSQEVWRAYLYLDDNGRRRKHMLGSSRHKEEAYSIFKRGLACLEQRKPLPVAPGRDCSKGSSQFRGVEWRKDKNKWRATIKNQWRATTKNGVIALGCYDDEEAAARAFDVAARQREKDGGSRAKCNFPTEKESEKECTHSIVPWAPPASQRAAAMAATASGTSPHHRGRPRASSPCAALTQAAAAAAARRSSARGPRHPSAPPPPPVSACRPPWQAAGELTVCRPDAGGGGGGGGGGQK
jgi:hypothetical protein